MQTGYLTNLIRRHPFLQELNPHYFHLLTECASLMRTGIGQEIFHESENARHFYLICRGRVALETFVSGGNITVQTLGAGEALGWSGLIPPYRWHLTARAIEPCELIAFGADELREAAEENHDFGYDLTSRIARVMAKRFHFTQQKLIDSYAVVQ